MRRCGLSVRVRGGETVWWWVPVKVPSLPVFRYDAKPRPREEEGAGGAEAGGGGGPRGARPAVSRAAGWLLQVTAGTLLGGGEHSGGAGAGETPQQP